MQKIITIDPDHCTGCRSCEMVCSLEHDRICGPLLSRITISQWREISANVPIVCQHCEISRPWDRMPDKGPEKDTGDRGDDHQ